MSKMRFGKYIVADPEVCHGELTFDGTRVPVETVLSYLTRGMTVDEVPKHWPRVSRAAAMAALRLAKEALVAKHRVTE